ncbi:MAG: hypothetical protein LBQ22_04145 [Bacteroidales bacterium]|nr:hypothetical protein [Bacteroidales bacterium]
MEYIDILGLSGIITGIFGVAVFTRTRRWMLFILAMICLIVYSVIRPIYLLTIVLILILGIFIYIVKVNGRKSRIRLEEVSINDEKVKEFIETYKKDIYNFFPFYQFDEGQRFFIILSDNITVGIFIYTISGDVLKVEVDYIKPIYRDLGTGNYIYNKNPGYFKKLGINKILSQSFHKAYSRSLKKIGFKVQNVNGQQFYIKSLE